MARRFLDDIRADIASLMADNTTGLISAADQRLVMLDTIDSTIQDECRLADVAPTLGIAVGTSFQNLDTIFGAQEGGDGVFLIPNFSSGTITGNVVPGFSYVVSGAISVAAVNNTRIQLGVGVNAVQTNFVANHEASGATEYYTIAIRIFIGSAGISDIFTLMISTPDGASSVNIASANLTAIIVPTNNPA